MNWSIPVSRIFCWYILPSNYQRLDTAWRKAQPRRPYGRHSDCLLPTQHMQIKRGLTRALTNCHTVTETGGGSRPSCGRPWTLPCTAGCRLTREGLRPTWGPALFGALRRGAAGRPVLSTRSASRRATCQKVWTRPLSSVTQRQHLTACTF